MPAWARVSLLLCGLLLCGHARAATARCHVVYGGEEWTVDAAPTASPYRGQGHKIGRYFEFKLVHAELPGTGAFIRIYTYGMSSGDPVLIHQATYRPPFDPRTAAYGFTGFQYVYEPSKSSELQYWCEYVR
ncbi:hypothetical protein H1235_08405 [Pseudoxanthomonas sp. NC8]|nr:hypothetical protein H1235_08405 [Pseudoxanthomonas sp. NC8]